MKKIILIAILLSGCVQPQNAYYDPYQRQREQAFYNALLQAGQPSPVPISNGQALGTAAAAYNGMPLAPMPQIQQGIHCTSTKTGIWTNTNCY